MRRLRTHAVLAIVVAAAAGWAVIRLVASSVEAVGQNQNQQPEIELVIGGDGGTPPRYAVPDFVAASPDAAEIAKTISQVLWDDLELRARVLPHPARHLLRPCRRRGRRSRCPLRRGASSAPTRCSSARCSAPATRCVVQVRLLQRAHAPVGVRQGVQRHRVEPAALRPHDRRRGPPAAARAARRRAHEAEPSSRTATRERLLGPIDNREVKEIYVSDYDGGEPAAHHHHPAAQHQSRRGRRTRAPSPTRRTANRDAADLHLAHLSGRRSRTPPRASASNYMPVFSPDGTRIAFVSNRDGNPEIYVMNRDGSNVRRLTNHPAGEMTPTWSPNGTQIAFTSDRAGQAADLRHEQRRRLRTCGG